MELAVESSEHHGIIQIVRANHTGADAWQRLTRRAQFAGRVQPGKEYKNKAQQVLANRTDSADVYAVLYRNHDEEGNPTVLYGDNVLTSPLIVRKARIDFVKPTDEWTFFELPFTELAPVDEDLLSNRGYSLALVFAASIHGDMFEGAIGSTLYIDKVRVICTHEE